jgi:hypothetical protein
VSHLLIPNHAFLFGRPSHDDALSAFTPPSLCLFAYPASCSEPSITSLSLGRQSLMMTRFTPSRLRLFASSPLRLFTSSLRPFAVSRRKSRAFVFNFYLTPTIAFTLAIAGLDMQQALINQELSIVSFSIHPNVLSSIVSSLSQSFLISTQSCTYR